MKKMLCLLLAVFWALSCPALAAAQETPDGRFSPEGSVLFEKNGVRVTTAGLDWDPTDSEPLPIIWVEIENTADQEAYLGVAEGSVNGIMTDVVLIAYYEEDGQYTGADYCFDLTLPAGSAGRYALGYYRRDVPGVRMDVLAELTFCFTLAEDAYSWPGYRSAPVTVVTGESAELPDIASLGTVVRDDDTLRLVIGEQDYDDFMGPLVYVYAENKADVCLGLTADSATADGVFCDYIFFGETVSPGKLSVGWMSFDGELRELKGFEELALCFSLRKAATLEGLDTAEAEALEPVTVRYPPQVWGEYENGGLRLEIQPRYNALLTVETPEDDPNGILFSVSETASLEAGAYEGAGWLFAIAAVSEERLHEMLCRDMSGVEVFARDDSGRYYLYCHPTDVRFERRSAEEFASGMAQWSMLCQWGSDLLDRFRDQNGLEYAAFGNSEVEMSVARAAWQEGVKATLSTTEFGPLDIAGVDGAPYAALVLEGAFYGADPAETPDGEYVVLNFPEEELRVDFFFAPGDYVRVVSGELEQLYQAMWYDEDSSYAEVMQDWYYALAEKNGLR